MSEPHLTAIDGKTAIAVNGQGLKTRCYKFPMAKPVVCGKYMLKRLEQRIEPLTQT